MPPGFGAVGEAILAALFQAADLTLADRIQLEATLEAFHSEKVQCVACLGMYPGRQNRDQVIRAERVRKGCFGIDLEHLQPKQLPGYTLAGVRVLTCPGNLWDEEMAVAIKAWQQLVQHGVLPGAGGYLDQDAKLLAVFDHVAMLEHQRGARQQKRSTKGKG